MAYEDEIHDAVAHYRANTAETALIAALNRADEILGKLDETPEHEEQRDILRDIFRDYERTLRDVAVLLSLTLGAIGKSDASLELAALVNRL